MDGWNTTFLLGFGLFSGAMLVSGRVFNNHSKSEGWPLFLNSFHGSKAVAKQNPLDRCEKDPGADPEHNMCSAKTEILEI